MSELPDGVEIRGQRLVVVDWAAYIEYFRQRGHVNVIPRILCGIGKVTSPQEQKP
jgi:hypothetical protein